MQLTGQQDAHGGVRPAKARRFERLRTLGRKRRVKDLEDSPATLVQVIADLEHLNRNTEHDFLNLGERLSGFIEAVDSISSQLTALSDLVSPEQGLRAAHALTGILGRLNKIKTRAGEGTGLLDGMLQGAGQVRQTLCSFNGTVSTLTTLGVLTQIETARLGAAGADFGPLADDVKSLSGSVQERVENAIATASQLIPPIEGALVDAAAREKQQGNDLPSMISGILAHLSSFGEIQKRAHDSSVRMRSRYTAISDAFKKLVISIQFHDITRQQVEHVIEILRRLSSGSEGQDAPISRDPRGLAAAVALQSSQLGDAGEKFARSVLAITQSLDGIASHVLAMAEESRSLSGLSEAESKTSFLQMEQACTAMLAGLVHCADAELANQTTHNGLAETIGTMGESIRKIEAVEIQIERLASNASVRAEHIGKSGDALAVLAGTMQQLAFESKDRSQLLAQTLGSMSQASARLSVRCASAKSAHCKDTMRPAIEELHASNERSFAQIEQVLVRGRRLREDLAAARNSFSVGAVFAEAVGRARTMLEAVARQVPSSRRGAGALERGLDDFSQHYTMQAERDVHEGVTKTVVGSAPVAIEVEQAAFPPRAAEETAENVEFF
jgi:hypothetical protein